MVSRLPSHRDLGLSQRWGYVQVFRYVNVTKVVAELDAPDREPVDVVRAEFARQLDLDVLTLVATQRVQGTHLVGYLG